MKLTCIGKFSEPHALRGAMKLRLFSGDYSWFEEAKEILIAVKGNKDPAVFTKARADQLNEIELSNEDFNKISDIENYFCNEEEPFVYQGFWLFMARPQSFKKQPKEAMVFLKGVTNRNQSDFLKNARVFLRANFFVSEQGEKPFLQELLGFKVLLKDGRQLLGTIVGFSSNRAQDLLQIQMGDEKKILEIPLIEAFTEEIDYQEKWVLVSLPPGYLEAFS